MQVSLNTPSKPPAAFPARTRKLRLGVVGGGGNAFIGRVHSRGAILSGRWEVVAGALSSRPDLAAASARDWLIADDRSYESWAEMARAEAGRPDGIDAVAITVPNHLHFPVAMAFMEAGIDVICDKPLVNSIAEARTLQEMARKTGLVFGVTYSYAGHSMVRQARQMIREGMIGRVTQIHGEFLQEMAMLTGEDAWSESDWRKDPDKVGGAATTSDIGSHAHHLAEYVSGLDLEELRCDFHTLGAPQPLEDSAFFSCRYSGGVPGTLLVSQAMAGSQCELRFRISGTEGTLEWNQEDPEFLHHRPFNAPSRRISRGHGAGMLGDASRFVHMPRGHPEALSDAWANIYEEMAIAVEARRTGTALPEGLLAYPDLRAGIRGVAFIQAAIASDRAGGAWTRLET